MKALWPGVGIVALLVAMLVLLLVRGSGPDLPLRRTMQERLRVFELRDAELTRDALLARAGLLPNYDALARDRRQLVDALAALRSAGAAAGAELDAPLAQLGAALDARLGDVEDFKTDDALLRNSVAYLIYNVARLDLRQRDIGELSSAFLRFVQAPAAATAEAFRAALAHLAERPGSDDELAVLVAHGTLVADALPKVVELLRRIEGAPTLAALAELQGAVDRASAAAEGSAQVYRYGLFGVALLLLGYLVRQFLRLRAAGLELRDREERLSAVARSAHDAIVTSDRGGAIVSWNPAAERIFGYAADEILGAPLARLMPALPAGATAESTGVRKDGREFPLEASIAAWSTAKARYTTAIVRDASERKALEETARAQEQQLVQANKMTALGTLVAGVAHEINNPNQLVLFNAALLADAWRDAIAALDEHLHDRPGLELAGIPYAEMRGAVPALIDDLRDGALRIDRIVQDLKDFARPQPRALVANLDLNDVVQRAARLLGHLIKQRSHRFELALAPRLPPLHGDAQQLEQVVVNLLVNALEALPDPERGVRIATRAGADGVVLEVRDDGVGIPAEHLQRLCDPFFTTKQGSGGTGLGLAVTYALVHAHGGRLDFDSTLGVGTCATVRFPAAAAA